jgi:hypothetical protein
MLPPNLQGFVEITTNDKQTLKESIYWNQAELQILPLNWQGFVENSQNDKLNYIFVEQNYQTGNIT